MNETNTTLSQEHHDGDPRMLSPQDNEQPKQPTGEPESPEAQPQEGDTQAVDIIQLIYTFNQHMDPYEYLSQQQQQQFIGPVDWNYINALIAWSTEVILYPRMVDLIQSLLPFVTKLQQRVYDLQDLLGKFNELKAKYSEYLEQRPGSHDYEGIYEQTRVRFNGLRSEIENDINRFYSVCLEPYKDQFIAWQQQILQQSMIGYQQQQQQQAMIEYQMFQNQYNQDCFYAQSCQETYFYAFQPYQHQQSYQAPYQEWPQQQLQQQPQQQWQQQPPSQQPNENQFVL